MPTYLVPGLHRGACQVFAVIGALVQRMVAIPAEMRERDGRQGGGRQREWMCDGGEARDVR